MAVARARGVASLLLPALLMMPAGAMAQSVRYVNSAASPGGDGLSWATAFRHLQDGLASAAASGGAVTQIWVAGGVYRPDAGASQSLGDRTASFNLVSQVSILGGFAGGETSISQRNIAANPTRLSGDLLGNDLPTPMVDDNSYHVVQTLGGTSGAVLDGLTISGGYTGLGDGLDSGGGLYCVQSSVTLRDCVVTGNQTASGTAISAGSGGGIHAVGGTLTLQRCRVIGNAAGNGRSSSVTSGGSGGSGGGIYALGQSIFMDCEFGGNSAGSAGSHTGFTGTAGAAGHGGALLLSGTATIVRCVFVDNVAGEGGYSRSGGSDGGHGGAIHAGSATISIVASRFLRNGAGRGGWGDHDIDGRRGGNGGGLSIAGSSSLSLVNSLFVANTAGKGGTGSHGGRGGDGGGVYFSDFREPTIVNCSLEGNEAGAPGDGMPFAGMGGNGGGLFLRGTSLTIANCVLFRNRAGGGGFGDAILADSTPLLRLMHSAIENGMSGISMLGGSALDWPPGNIAGDPQYVDVDGADKVPGTLDDDLRLQGVSPCIDAGANANVPAGIIADANGFVRFVDWPKSVDCPYAPGTCGNAPIVDMGACEFALFPLVAEVKFLPATPG